MRRKPGIDSQYSVAFVDSKGQPFDGTRTYHMHLPANIPAKHCWSILLYDNMRSMIQADRPFPSLNSQSQIEVNGDSSVDIYFGPMAPEGKKGNWIQTPRGSEYSVMFRLYGPLPAWFDKSWRPGVIEEMRAETIEKVLTEHSRNEVVFRNRDESHGDQISLNRDRVDYVRRDSSFGAGSRIEDGAAGLQRGTNP
jgi:Protein of unknown function (DUF1214)